MGPRSDERGNRNRSSDHSHHGTASMGPRSDERGNSAAECFSTSRAALQWGRALMSAEIHQGQTCLRNMWLLQWGRALMSAEMRPIVVPWANRCCFNGAAL